MPFGQSDLLCKKVYLQGSEKAASTLLSGLIFEGYIDGRKLTPTSLGMALAAAEDRDRLCCADAREILSEFLDAVKVANAKPGARILIERVHVYGSYLQRSETVGDIDLLIEAPLPPDCQPEDMDEPDEIFAEIKISEFLSYHDEFGSTVMTVEKELIYDRRNPESGPEL